MRSRSLTWRLTIFFALVSAAVLLGAGSLIGTRVQAHFVEADLADMQGKLELVRHLLARSRSPDSLDSVRSQLADALVGHRYLELTVLSDPKAELFRTPHATFPPSLLRWPPADQGALIEWEHDGRTHRGIAGAAQTGIAGQGPVAVAVGLDVEHHRQFMVVFRTSLIIALMFGVTSSAVLGWIAAHGGLAPLRELTRAVQGISAGRLDRRLSTDAMPAELVALGAAFNKMLARLEEAFSRLSDYSSDIAHELRTPISNLMLQTQVAASKARSAEEYREVLYANLEEFERLARMVGDMLFLARADNGLAVPSRDSIDLLAELPALFGFYESLAEEQGVRLIVEGSGVVEGDRLMIRRALSNLLANAIRHTPHGAAVRVQLDQRPGGGVQLRMCNPGSIAPEHLPRLFERFYQVEPSRQSTGGWRRIGARDYPLDNRRTWWNDSCRVGLRRGLLHDRLACRCRGDARRPRADMRLPITNPAPRILSAAAWCLVCATSAKAPNPAIRWLAHSLHMLRTRAGRQSLTDCWRRSDSRVIRPCRGLRATQPGLSLRV